MNLNSSKKPTNTWMWVFVLEFSQQMKSSPNWPKCLLPSCLTNPQIIVVPKLGFQRNHLGRFKIHWPLPSWSFDVIGLRCTPSDSIEQPKLSTTARLTSFPCGCFQVTGHNQSSCRGWIPHSCLPCALSYAQHTGLHMFAKWTCQMKQGFLIPRIIRFL